MGMGKDLACAVLAAIIGASATKDAAANGAPAEFAAGGVIFLEAVDIAIEREDLFVSRDEVRVRYVYRSLTGEPQDATLGFPMPPVPILADDVNYLGGRGPGDGDPRNYLNFSVAVDGRPVESIMHEFAELGPENATSVLGAYGIPPFLPPEKVAEMAELPEDVLAELEKAGMIRRSKSVPGLIIPLWDYSVNFEWLQAFSADRTVVEISYRPLVGYNVDDLDLSDDGIYARPYCIDDAFRAGVERRLERQYFEPATLGYILMTSHHWAGPIGEFNLTVSKAVEGMKPEDTLVAFCPLEAKRVSPTEFTFTALDYRPTDQLRVLYLDFIDRGE